MQLESGDATFVARPRLFNVLRVEIYPNDPVHAGADGAVETVATSATMIAMLFGQCVWTSMLNSAAMSGDWPTVSSAMRAS